MKLGKKVVTGTLMAVCSMAMLSQPVLAEGEMEIIDRIRPVGKVKISGDRDVALVESLQEEKAEEPSTGPAVAEVKEAVVEAVDQAAEATKEVVEQAVEATDNAIAAVSETAEVVADQAAEATDSAIAAVSETADVVAEQAAEVVDKAEEAVAKVAGAPDEQGLQVFNKSCFACHGTGIPGIPKVADKEAWAPRIAQGEAVLVEHATNGFNAMPARGGNAALTDEEIKAAVAYLVAEGS